MQNETVKMTKEEEIQFFLETVKSHIENNDSMDQKMNYIEWQLRNEFIPRYAEAGEIINLDKAFNPKPEIRTAESIREEIRDLQWELDTAKENPNALFYQNGQTFQITEDKFPEMESTISTLKELYESIKLKEAYETLTSKIREDKDFYRAYYDNLTMVIRDCITSEISLGDFTKNKIAKDAATIYLNRWINKLQ